MPRCNTYGLQGTEFLDPPPVPKPTARGRPWMMVGPPYGDFSPDELGVFDEDEEEAIPEEQGHSPPPASHRGKEEVPTSSGGAGVELPPRAASISKLAGGAGLRRRVRGPPATDSCR